MIIYHPVEQGSKEWLELRAPLWTGSKALNLLMGKSLPRDDSFEGNKYTRRGQILETIAIREYERRYRRPVARPGFITNSVYTNAGYSPDGIDGRILLEAKAFKDERHEDLVAEKIPLVVLVQIYFGMIITGCRRARLLAINPEYEEQLSVIEITYDKVIGGNIRKKLRLDIKKRLLDS